MTKVQSYIEKVIEKVSSKYTETDVVTKPNYQDDEDGDMYTEGHTMSMRKLFGSVHFPRTYIPDGFAGNYNLDKRIEVV